MGKIENREIGKWFQISSFWLQSTNPNTPTNGTLYIGTRYFGTLHFGTTKNRNSLPAIT